MRKPVGRSVHEDGDAGRRIGSARGRQGERIVEILWVLDQPDDPEGPVSAGPCVADSQAEGGGHPVGDGHFAQGDAECCGTAIEMGATAVVRFRLHRGEAAAKRITWPRFAHPGYFAPPEMAAPRNFIATMGMPITPEGRNENCDITLAARNAVINMIELLLERGWTREQAYVLCSVAVDLRVSNVVDVPNVTVSALLPEEIFSV